MGKRRKNTMGLVAAIVGGIGGLCAVMGILIAFEVTAEIDIKDLGWMFWFVLSAILLLGSIAFAQGRGPGGGPEYD
jgi:hypothetical protein